MISNVHFFFFSFALFWWFVVAPPLLQINEIYFVCVLRVVPQNPVQFVYRQHFINKSPRDTRTPFITLFTFFFFNIVITRDEEKKT